MEAGNVNDFANMNNEQSRNHCQVHWIESKQEHHVFNYDEGSEEVKWIHGCRCVDESFSILLCIFSLTNRKRKEPKKIVSGKIQLVI